MYRREKLAHHEAAHAVVALLLDAGLSEIGIDLDAPTSLPGATGTAGVKFLRHDPSASVEEQKKRFMSNLVVACAGAASDARTSGIPLREALRNQPGDERFALGLICASPIHGAEGDQELLLEAALLTAEFWLGKPETWAWVQAVAVASGASGGRLTKPEVIALQPTVRGAEVEPALSRLRKKGLA